MNTERPDFLYDCVECGEEFPRSAFGKAKKRNPRCMGEGTNNCSAAYRRRNRKEKSVQSHATSEDQLLREFWAYHRADLSEMSDEDKEKRRNAQRSLSKKIKSLPADLRELHELRRVEELLAQYPTDRGIHAHFNTGQILSYRYSYLNGGKFIHLPDFKYTYQKRIALLEDRIKDFDQDLVDFAFQKELDRISDAGGDPTGDYGYDKVSLTPEEEEELNVAIDKRTRSLKYKLKKKAKEQGTPEGFAEYVSFKAAFKFSETFGDPRVSHRLLYARLAGDARSVAKYEKLDQLAQGDEAEAREEVENHAYHTTLTKWKAVAEAGKSLPTWEEFAPDTYGADTLKKRFSQKRAKSNFCAEQWQKERWVTLSDTELGYFEAALKGHPDNAERTIDMYELRSRFK